VVRVAEDSQPYITVSSETTGFPFHRLLRLAEITAEVFLPVSARVKVSCNKHLQISALAGRT
jgi:hypothetical protein